MSFELLAAGALGGLVGGYFMLRRWFTRGAGRRRSPSEAPGAGSRGAALAELRLGDVVGIGMREYWLTGGYSLEEAGHALSTVFSAEESRLVVTLGVQAALYLGHEVSLTLPTELPARLEHLDHTFCLKSRLPVEMVTLGRASRCATSAQWGCYDDGGEQTLWVLRTPDSSVGIVSKRVPERDIFRWGNANDA